MSLPATISLVLLATVGPLWWRPADAWDVTPPLDFKRFAYARTSAGRLRGFETTVGVPPRSALVFKRIPYAAPPVGRLRFRKAQRPDRWHGDWDATKYGPACLSNTSKTTSPQTNISEDCLHVNIFTSPGCVNGRRKCPVLVYIHGGGFYYDSAVMFSDRQIAEKYASDDVVFVIPAFRLGVFAAFDVGDSDIVPPNLGLEDVIFALQWTRREIGAFGGDPSQLTVMGNSGGGSITELLMSHRRVPKSLFQRAIVSSGTSPSADWGAARPLSDAVLNWFNCSTHSVGGKRAQVACLRDVNATALLEAQRVLVDERGFLFAPITPTADLPVDDLGRLLRQIKPRTLWASVTSNEYRPERENTTSSSCQEAASWLGYKSPAVKRACMDRFYPNQDPDERPAKDVLNAAQTSAMHARTLLLALVNAHKSSSSYYSTFALANHSRHSDDLLFFFGLHWTRRAYTPAEALMDHYYPRVVKNFVRHGRPESFWRPIESDGKGYFVFDFAVDANSTASVDEAAAGRTLRRLRLTRWPRFVADAYDDPVGERFWLLDQARAEAASLGWTDRRAGGRANGTKDDGEDNHSDNDWNEKNRNRDKNQTRPIFGHAKRADAQREYERRLQKTFDAHRRPYKASSDESSDDYQPVYQYDDNEEENENENADHDDDRDQINVVRQSNRRALADAKERVKQRKRDDLQRAGANLKRLRRYLAAKKRRHSRHNYRNGHHDDRYRDRHEDDRSDDIDRSSVEPESRLAENSAEDEEPVIHTSRKSVETAWRYGDSPTVGELLDDVKRYVERKDRKDEPLIEPSRTSVEWAVRSKHQTTVGDLVDNLKRYAKWKDFKDEPLIEPSRTSVEWAVDGGESVDEVADDAKHWVEKKERRDEPWIRPSRTSAEWARGKKWHKNHVSDSEDSNERTEDGSQDNDWSHSAENFWEAVKAKVAEKSKDKRRKSPLADVPFVYRMNVTRNGLNCTYAARRVVGQRQVEAHFKCVHANGTKSHGNGKKVGQPWKYSSDNKNYNEDSNDDNNRNDSYRNRSERWRKHRRQGGPGLDCRPDGWWRRIGHGPGPVRLPYKNDKNASTNDKNATNVSRNVNRNRWQVQGVANVSHTVADAEPPFWLPFVAFNFDSALAMSSEERDDNDTVAGDTEIATTVEIEDDDTVDLTYYDALERLRSAEDTLRAALAGRIVADAPPPPYAHTAAAPSSEPPLGWMALSVVALAVAVAMIVVAARLLFRYRSQRQRGYDYNSRAGDYLNETSRILSNPRGNAPKYSN